MSRPGPLARLLLALLRLYQLGVSPYLSPRCRFLPSCSAYAVEAVHVHGAGRGGWLALRRVARCHPLCHGGWDPVPERRVRDAGHGPDPDRLGDRYPDRHPDPRTTSPTAVSSTTGFLPVGADRGARSC
jgi:putative membrane protein insertion efficiency factor